MRTPTLAYYRKIKQEVLQRVLEKGQLFCASEQEKSMKK